MEPITQLPALLPSVEEAFNFLETRPGRALLSISLIILAALINRIMHWRLMLAQKVEEDHAALRATWVRRKNLVWVTAVLLIVALWSNMITGFLISLAAIGGALLIVSKELILCLWGALIISVNKNIKIGSTIEIGRYTGQLVNTGFVTFELAEIGPSKKQTGRLLSLPNALIFTEPMKNLSIYGAYGVHLIDFHFDKHVKLQVAETLALRLANEAGKHWVLQAEQHFSAIEKNNFVDLPKARPETYWMSVDEKCLRMTLRLACPLNKRGQIEKTIVKRFWVEYPLEVAKLDTTAAEPSGEPSNEPELSS